MISRLLLLLVFIAAASAALAPTLAISRRQVPTSSTKIVSDSINELALDLVHEKKNEQAAYSPFSIASVLNLLYLAAGDGSNTKNQLRVLLRYLGTENEASIHTEYKNIIQDLAFAGSTGVNITVANGLFFQEDYRVLTDYAHTAQTHYNATLQGLNIAEDNVAATKFINRWVKDATGGKIKKLFESPLSRNSIFVLVNTIYFNGPWKFPFDPQFTTKRDFQVAPGVVKLVPMMTSAMRVKHIQYNFNNPNDYKAPGVAIDIIELPYEGDQFSMFVVLPREGTTLTQVENNLLNLPYKLDELIYKMEVKAGSVRIPRMKLRTKMDLAPVFKKFGAPDMFDSSSADFSKMVHEHSWVDAILHETVIDVNEIGTKAAAATGTMFNRVGASFTFDASRPFFFFIRDKTHGVPLFWAKVTDPTQ